MKKSIVFMIIYVISFSMIFCLLSGVTHAQQDFDVNVDNAVLMDAHSGQVLFEKNPHDRRPSASLGKLMTMLLAMEAIEVGTISLDDTVSVSLRASRTPGSKIWLNHGEEISVKDLLLAITVPSANDASVALAEYIGGTEGNFVSLMNRRAQELGLENTMFDNASGLPVEGDGVQYISPYDTAVLCRELLKYPEIIEWASMWAIKIRDEWRANTNRTFLQVFDGANGLKTGWTSESGYSLAATATRGDMTLIAVVMGADTAEIRREEAGRLLDYGFRRFHLVPVAKEGVKVGTATVINAMPEIFNVVSSKDLSVLIAKGRENDLIKEIILEDNIRAPIEAGQDIGVIKAYLDDQLLGEENIQAAGDVERASIFVIVWRHIRNFFAGLFS